LPTNKSLLESIHFAQSECLIDDAFDLTDTSIECTLATEEVCGKYKPIVLRDYGLIPVV
jgi:hypothetical protein